MLSPAKAITAGALIFAIGGVLAIARPFDQKEGDGQADTATIDPCTTPIVGITGTVTWGGQQPGGETLEVDGVTHLRDFMYHSTWHVDDSRLSGAQIFDGEWDFDGVAGISRGTIRIENADGAWEGPWMAIGPATDDWRGFMSLTGEGAYEGLSASVFEVSGSAGALEGSIYPTDIASCDFASME